MPTERPKESPLADVVEQDAADWFSSEEGAEAIAECHGSVALVALAAFKAGVEKERGK